MKNIFKIFVLCFLILILFFTYVNASDIVMNLEDNGVTNTEANVTSSENASNQNAVENNIVSNSTNTGTVTVTSSSENGEFLTAENILSIITIVIGILLVLLSIAILTRFK